MNPDSLRFLASEIVAQTLVQHRAFWAVLACLTVVFSALGGYLGAYVKKRGEQAALSADFDSVKRQLHETTALTESIKTDIKHLAERSERIRWLKQEKLEAYTLSILEVVDYRSAEMYHQFFDAAKPVSTDPWNAATMLQILYLPEVGAPHAALSEAMSNFQRWIAVGIQQRSDLWKTTGIKSAPDTSHCDQYSIHLATMNAAVLAIQTTARELAGKLTKV